MALPNKTPYIIGETASHHEGDEKFLYQLIDEIAESGCQAIKFHVLIESKEYFIETHEAIEVVNKWVFSENKWEEIINYSYSKNIDVIILCNDVKALDLSIKLNDKIKAIELHAVALNDFYLLQGSIKFNGTVILGVGGSTIDEIQYAVDYLKKGGQNDIFLMYGFQNYPTDYNDINFSKMLKLKSLFDLPMGYADHTDPEDDLNEIISTLPILLGINVLEKHITNAYGQKRIDHQSAITFKQFEKVKQLANIFKSVMGNGNLEMSDAEKSYGNTGPMKKAIVASQAIAVGDTLSVSNLAFKRTNNSSYLTQNKFPQLLGLKVTQPIEKDEIIDFKKVEYNFQKANFDQFNPK